MAGSSSWHCRQAVDVDPGAGDILFQIDQPVVEHGRIQRQNEQHPCGNPASHVVSFPGITGMAAAPCLSGWVTGMRGLVACAQ
jgi:hypothetical protein